jgi:menaquinone-dependent protoporphyrinogen IX oxidase
MTKVLVVYYSHTGTARHLAQMLARMQEWPRGEVVDVDARHGAFGRWRCIVDSMLRRRPQIRYKGPAPAEHDAVVLVSPIWAWRMASPMRSFVIGHRDALRDVALVSVMDKSGAENAEAELAHLLGRKPVMTVAFLSHEVRDGTCAARLQAFAGALRAAEDRAVAHAPHAWTAHPM